MIKIILTPQLELNRTALNPEFIPGLNHIMVLANLNNIKDVYIESNLKEEYLNTICRLFRDNDFNIIIITNSKNGIPITPPKMVVNTFAFVGPLEDSTKMRLCYLNPGCWWITKASTEITDIPSTMAALMSINCSYVFMEQDAKINPEIIRYKILRPMAKTTIIPLQKGFYNHEKKIIYEGNGKIINSF